MDEQKDSQDLVVGNDGSMSQGTSIKVTSDDIENTEPAVNEIQAPPDSTEIDVKTDTPENESENVGESVIKTDEIVENSQENTDSDGLVEAPETIGQNSNDSTEAITPIDTESSNLEQKTDPFAPDKTAEPIAPTTPQTMSNNEQAKPHEHRNNKKLAVIVTVLVALLLASAVVYVYVSAQDNTKQTNSKSASSDSAPVAEIAPATTEDIDQSVAEIDAAIILLENETDLSEDTISDSSLGL